MALLLALSLILITKAFVDILVHEGSLADLVEEKSEREGEGDSEQGWRD